MEIVKVDYKEYNLEENQAKQISAMFKPMLDKHVELEARRNEIMALPINPETCDLARELRLEYKRTRMGTAKIHKDLKAIHLQRSRFIDAWKNTQLMASQGAEDKLAEIENHYALMEQKKIDDLQVKREKALKKFEIETIPPNLGELDSVTWNDYLTGTKVNYEKRKAEEKRVEEERVETERKNKIERDRKEASAKYSGVIPGYGDIKWGELEEKKFRSIMVKAINDVKAKELEDERILKENEKLLADAKEKERVRKLEETKRLAKEKKDKEAQDKILTQEREKREKAEADLKAIADEKVRQKQAEEDRVEAELGKGDAAKWLDLITDLEALKTKYTFKAKTNQVKYDTVCVLLSKIINWIP